MELPPGSEVRARAVPKKRKLRTTASPKSTRTFFRLIRINESRTIGSRTPYFFLFSHPNLMIRRAEFGVEDRAALQRDWLGVDRDVYDSSLDDV